MNGFEPMRRCITDYTSAGQWSEVYNGPVEDCEEYRLKAENAELRELIADVHEALRADKVGMFHKLILASMEDDMRELGIEVE